MRKLALALTVTMLALPVLAQQGPPQGPPQGPAGPQAQAEQPAPQHAVIRFLELTEEQVAAWNAMIEQLKADVQPVHEQLKAVEQELRELLGSEAPDATAVGALVLEGKALREQIAELEIAYVEAFEALLTEAQAARLTALRRAERLQPLFAPFRLFHLLPPR